jgi:O-antigen ligase
MVENVEIKKLQLKFPVLKGILILLQAAVLLFFSLVLLPEVIFIVISLVLFLLWVVTFYIEGVYEVADIPMLFLVLGTVAYGRAFSLLGIPLGNIPFYVTEIMLAGSLVFLLLTRKSLKKIWKEWRFPLPRGLMMVLAAYFLMGTLYLLIGVLGNGFLALRDIVFCHYLLFLFIAPGVLSKPVKIQSLMPFFIPGMIIILWIGLTAFFIYIPSSFPFKQFVKEGKMFNLSLYCGLIVIFGLSFFTFLKRKMKPVIGVLIFLSLLFIIMTEVRASWLALLVTLIFLVILLKKEIKVLIVILVVMAGSLFIIDHFQLAINKQKMEVLAEEVKSMTRRSLPSMPAANIKWRLNIWKQTGEEIREHPIFGWGFGIQINYEVWKKELSWLKAMGANTGILPVHNHVLAITYKMGLVGLALFLFINFRVFFYGLFYIKRCKSGFNRRFLIASLAGLVYWHGMAFFFDVLESPPTGIFLWILLGCILGLVYVDQDLKEETTKDKKITGKP